MTRTLVALTVLLSLIAMTADAAPRKEKKKPDPPSPTPAADAALRKGMNASAPPATSTQVDRPSDRFMSCDVRARDYTREKGVILTVKKIDVDDVKLRLNVHHEYGEAGNSDRRILRGDSEEDMRKNLYAILEDLHEAQKAAAAGRAWFVIAPRRDMPQSDPRMAGPAVPQAVNPWVGVVLADINGKCRPVAFYDSVALEKYDPELSKRLEE